MAGALILWPLYNDVGVTYTPTYAGGLWQKPLANLQDRRLHVPARSLTALLEDSRARCDLGVDRVVRGVVLSKHNFSTAAKWRVLGVPSTMLFDYEAGEDISAIGGTFARAPTAGVLAATYVDEFGVVKYAGENRCLQSEDFSTTWSASSVTVATDEVADPFDVTTADALTASGANGTVKQAVTTVAVTYTFSVWLRRKTGTGDVDITMDGTTWVTKTLTTKWQRFTVSQTGVAGTSNPGIRIGTNADAVYAFGGQVEIGSVAKSYLTTTTVAVGALRDGHYPVIGGARTTLVEPARTNLVLQAEDFGTTWTAVNGPTRTAAGHTAAGVTLDLIGDDDGAAAEYYEQAVTFTGDAVKAIAVFMKKGVIVSADGDQVVLHDATAAANRLLATITWDGAGVPSVVMTTGSHLDTVALKDGVYRFLFQTTSVTAANSNRVRCGGGRFQTNVADIGNVYAGGVQAEDALAPSSYIKTTTATVARAVEALSFTTSVPATPAALTALADYYDQGGGDAAANAHVFWLGAASTPDPSLRLLQRSSDGRDELTYDNNVDAAVSSTADTTATYGQRVEDAAQLLATGAVQLHRALDGASFTDHGASSAPAAGLAATWAETVVTIGADGSGALHNPLALRSLRIAIGIVTGANMRTIVHDSGWIDGWPSGVAAEESEGMNIDAVHILSAAFASRYWSFQISDEANGDGFIDVGRHVVAKGYNPGTSFAYGGEIMVESTTTKERGPAGNIFVDEEVQYRVLKLDFSRILEAEAMIAFLRFARIVGIGRQFYFVWDDADTTYLMDRAFLASFVEAPGVRGIYKSNGTLIFASVYDIEEEM